MEINLKINTNSAEDLKAARVIIDSLTPDLIKAEEPKTYAAGFAEIAKNEQRAANSKVTKKSEIETPEEVAPPKKRKAIKKGEIRIAKDRGVLIEPKTVVSEDIAEEVEPAAKEPQDDKAALLKIRKTMQPLVDANREAIKAKFDTYGCTNLSTLSSERYSDFQSFLNTL